METLLTSGEAAVRAGVGPTAIKRWADLGLLPCVRTAGGHRRFRERELIAFLEHLALQEGAQGSAAAAFADRLLEAESGHEIEAQLLLLRGEQGAWHRAAPAIGAALAELGERWKRGELSVLDEHVASERLLRAIGRLSESIPVSPAAPLALLAAVEGDDHLLGLSLVELCLREAGLRTRWAGRAMPAAELAQSLRKGDVELLAVSASAASSDRRRLARFLQHIAADCAAQRVQLLLGGAGAWPDRPDYGTRLRSFEELRAFLAGRDRR